MAEVTAVRNHVFVSYSHADKGFLEQLNRHLALLERRNIKVWTDQQIAPGMKWRDEITAALAKTKVAVLMISTDFLTSNFITNKELPPLLAAAGEAGVAILPVLVKPSDFKNIEELSCYQAVNMTPLAKLKDDTEREEEFVKILQLIRQHMEGRAPRQATTAASAPAWSGAPEGEPEEGEEDEDEEEDDEVDEVEDEEDEEDDEDEDDEEDEDEEEDGDALLLKDGLRDALAAMQADPRLQTLSLQAVPSNGRAVELMQVTEGHNGGLLLEVLNNDELRHDWRLRRDKKRQLEKKLEFNQPQIRGDRFWRIYDPDEDNQVDLDEVTGDILDVLEDIFGVPDAEKDVGVAWQVLG